MKNNKILVICSLISLGLIFLIGTKVAQNKQIEETQSLAKENNEPFVRSYSPTMGNKQAKVTLVEFFDPACETCRDFYPLVKEMLKQSPNQIKLVLRYIPFHQGATDYVKILEASRKQGMYWETLEILYQSQHFWASHHHAKIELAWEVLKHTKLDLAKLKEDMKDPKILEIIQQDMADAQLLGVQKTPGFFVNGKPLLTFGYKPLKNLIQSEVQENYKNVQ